MYCSINCVLSTVLYAVYYELSFIICILYNVKTVLSPVLLTLNFIEKCALYNAMCTVHFAVCTVPCIEPRRPFKLV